jgi:phosphoribosylformylglycinamidine cyclo-ligase
MAHVTGGGITENLPRILPAGVEAQVDRSAWSVPAVFAWLQRTGRVPDEEMLRTFNMGIGLIAACASADEDRLLAGLEAAGEPGARRIGRLRAGAAGVAYTG